MKNKVLYFHTENEAELRDETVEDGFITIGDKQWFVDQTEPITLKGRLGNKSLYILKWDTPHPAQINPDDFNGKKIKIPKGIGDVEKIKKKMQKLTGLEKVALVQLVFTQDKSYTPEALKKTTSLSILGNMLKLKKEAPSIILLFIGVAVGVAVMWGLQYMGFGFF